MVWLVTHMWVALALAAFFGLLFGWAFRGGLLKGKTRKALVERDVAIVELDQARLEIDQLYAAQSSAEPAAIAVDGAELEMRETRVRELTDRLAVAHDEIEELKTKALAGAAVAGATGLAASAAVALGATEAEETADDADIAPEDVQAELTPPRLDADVVAEDASLTWKNRYLESRVRQLETRETQSGNAAVTAVATEDDLAADHMDQLQTAIDRADAAEAELTSLKMEVETNQQKSTATVLAATAASGVVGAAIAGQAAGADDDTITAPNLAAVENGNDKHAWQSYYLRHRLAASQSQATTSSQGAEGPVGSLVDNGPDLPAELENGSIQNANGAATAETEELRVQDDIAEWRTSHLKQNLIFLEDHPIADRDTLYGEAGAGLISVPADQAEEDVHDTSDLAVSQTTAEGVSIGASAGELEQELARLRWRNRYLEGRLAYVSGEMPGTGEAGSETVADVAAGDAIDDISPDVDKAEEPTPAEALLAAMDAAGDEAVSDKPPGLQQPEEGGDDLTRIEGVNEGIAHDLNALGIWHYHQIAGWTPDNIAWVGEEFGLGGLVADQQWTAQAGALSLGTELDMDS